MPGDGRCTPPELSDDEGDDVEDKQSVADEHGAQWMETGQERKGKEKEKAVSPRPAEVEVTSLCILL